MTDAIVFLSSAISGILNLVSSIFQAFVTIVPALIGYIGTMFSFLIFIIPLIFSFILYCIQHFYVILIIAECIILVRVITTAGMFPKLRIYFESHVQLFKWIISLPSFISDTINMFSKILQQIWYSLYFVWETTSNLINWIVTAGASNLVTGIITFGVLIAGFLTLMYLVHI